MVGYVTPGGAGRPLPDVRARGMDGSPHDQVHVCWQSGEFTFESWCPPRPSHDLLSSWTTLSLEEAEGKTIGLSAISVLAPWHVKATTSHTHTHRTHMLIYWFQIVSKISIICIVFTNNSTSTKFSTVSMQSGQQLGKTSRGSQFPHSRSPSGERDWPAVEQSKCCHLGHRGCLL